MMGYKEILHAAMDRITRQMAQEDELKSQAWIRRQPGLTPEQREMLKDVPAERIVSFNGFAAVIKRFQGQVWFCSWYWTNRPRSSGAKGP